MAGKQSGRRLALGFLTVVAVTGCSGGGGGLTLNVAVRALPAALAFTGGPVTVVARVSPVPLVNPQIPGASATAVARGPAGDLPVTLALAPVDPETGLPAPAGEVLLSGEVTLPANLTATAATYQVEVSASGPGGTPTGTGTATVTVAGVDAPPGGSGAPVRQ